MAHVRRGDLCEARGTKHAVVVLGDAFPAEVSRAARTARGSFPSDVIETTLVSQIGHA